MTVGVVDFYKSSTISLFSFRNKFWVLSGGGGTWVWFPPKQKGSPQNKIMQPSFSEGTLS